MNNAIALSSALANCTFRKGKEKGYCLLDVPVQYEERIYARLFMLRCKLIGSFYDKNRNYVALNFEAPAAIAARLALIFAAPKGAEPLLVNREGTRIVGGKAAQASDVQRQRIVGEPAVLQHQLN